MGRLVDLVGCGVLSSRGASANAGVGVLGDLLVGLLAGTGETLLDLLGGLVDGVLDDE